MIPIQNFTEYFVFIGAAVPVIYGAYRYVWKPLTIKVRQIMKLFTDAAEVHKIVKYEFRPNGGLSLRDSINRIESRQILFEARNRAMLNYSGLSLFESDSQGACVWVNRNYLRMTDRSLEDIIGWGWKNCIHPDDQTRVFKEWNEAVSQNREFISNYKIMTPDGESTSVHCEAMPLKNLQGVVIGHFGSIRILE